MSEQDFFFAIRNEDGSVTTDFPREWPQGAKDNFEAAIDLFVQRGKELEQARIIELLQQHLSFDYGVGIYDLESSCQLDPQQLVTLIKGETE